MEKHLRPARFECDPNQKDASKQWKHWFRTFENFINSFDVNTNTPVQQQEHQKLSTLINHVSSTVYEFISEAETYSKAIDILKSLYTKPVNVIYNRHVLTTRHQNEGETVDQLMQKLEKWSEQCEFTAESAETYRCDYVRDAFMNGLNSPIIRQRLLENNNLTLE